MTEAELAAIEALFKMGGPVEQERLLVLTLENMRQHQQSFDAAFLSACVSFHVPHSVYGPHERVIMLARQCINA